MKKMNELNIYKLFDALVRIYAARGIELTYTIKKKERESEDGKPKN